MAARRNLPKTPRNPQKKQQNPHGKNVCLLKEEKLLIEKLTLIIGGFYQQHKLKVSRLIKCFEEGETKTE